ncbi:MAG TPA: cytochrome c oxidase subunit II [Candidatus Didemnitutus sp.]|jgi:cytochrome c oxidase subunit 2
MTRFRSASRSFPRPAVALMGLAFLALASGCSFTEVFALHGPQSTYHTGGPVAQSQWDLFMVTVYVTAFIFVIVGGALAYATIKFKARSAEDEHFDAPQGHGNPLVEMGLIVGSVLLLVIIAIPTLEGIWYTHDVPEAEKGAAMDVTATAYQWWFKFEYPNLKVKSIAGENPLATGNELVVPAGVPVRVQLRTVDVIHSFWVPKLAGKVDMIPNRGNLLWFKADKPGYFYGQCAEYCGDSHAIMRFRVIALAQDDFKKWVENQMAPARSVTAQADENKPHAQFANYTENTGAGSVLSGSPEFDADPLAAWRKKQAIPSDEDTALIAAGRKLFSEKTCISCHTIRGHEGVGITGPELTHVGARSTIAAGVLENTPHRMSQWIHDPSAFKPGNKMFNGGYIDPATGQRKFTLTDSDIAALVAYLQSLK